jgi:hypothetical protein
VVYEQNLGQNTAAIVSKITTFNPDASWKQVASSQTLATTH